MRPVIHSKTTRPPAYQYFIGYDYSKDPWDFSKFSKENQKAIQNYFGKLDLTAQQCLDAWTQQAKNNNIDPGVDAKGKRKRVDVDPKLGPAVTQVLSKVETKYAKASTPLSNQLGDFCVFCEVLIQLTPQVEHRAPKSEYPQFSLAWDNFVLSCGPCNTRKGVKPVRAYVETHYLQGKAPKDLEEQDYYDALLTNYVWPDDSAEVYPALLPALAYFSITSNGYKPLPDACSVMPGQRIIGRPNYTKREIDANVFLSQDAAPTSQKVRVILVASGTNPKAQQTLDLCELNFPGKKDDRYDCMVLDRTEIWFQILAKLETGKFLPNDKFEGWWETFLFDAASWGFYSMWVQILKLTQQRDPNNALLVTRFINETNNANYFPGTDIAQVLAS